MSSILPVLRQARSEIMPLVPELAPNLPVLEEYGTVETDIVQQHLIGAIASRRVDPATIPPTDFNKLSRHTLAGAMIGLQREYLIEGEGNEARFRDLITSAECIARGSREERFGRELKGLQSEGAKHVRWRHTAGRDAASSWFPALDRRYNELGQAGLAITPSPPRRNRHTKFYPDLPIPVEGQSIDAALHTDALLSGVGAVLKFVRRKVRSTDARIEAAHDIAPLILGVLASTHFYEFMHPKLLGGTIGKNPMTNRNQLRQTAEQRRRLFVRLDASNLPNSRMKCPAHAAVEVGDTNMVKFIHASINLAAERHDLL